LIEGEDETQEEEGNSSDILKEKRKAAIGRAKP
jgi:hypothetical protein